MSKKIKDIFVLYKDYTYKFIDNNDYTIIEYAKKSKVQYVFFPVYGKNSIRYYKEDAKVIVSPIKIRLDGQLLLCRPTDDGLEYGYPINIHLEAKNIAESYSLIGSLYNITECCETIETEYTIIMPYLINFEIEIHVDGCEYKLDSEMYIQSVLAAAEAGNDYAKASAIYEKDFNAVEIYDIIHYIENTISYKDSRYSSLYDTNESYIVFDNNEYVFLDNKGTNTIPDNALLLMSLGSPLYMTILYKEYLMVNGCNRYDISYCVFEKHDLPSNENYIDDYDLSCEIIMELDDYLYKVEQEDTIRRYTVSEFLFMATAISDITELLLSEIASRELYDNNNLEVCYTCYLSTSDSFAHNALIGGSVTDKIIKDHHIDFLNMIVSDMKAYLKSRM